jgi:hypothetical protein
MIKYELATQKNHELALAKITFKLCSFVHCILSSKDNLLLIQCHYGRKPKLN